MVIQKSLGQIEVCPAWNVISSADNTSLGRYTSYQQSVTRRKKFLNNNIEKLKISVLSYLGWRLIKFFSFSMDIRFIHKSRLDNLKQNEQSGIYTFWHNRLLMMPNIAIGQKVAIIISQHRDGEYISQVMERFGFIPVRGSSTRGGDAGFRQLVRKMRSGCYGAITPDGPTGPRYKLKEGVLFLSAFTGCPIIPAAFNSSRKKVLSTWDHFLIPYPFSKGVMVVGQPIYLSKADLNNQTKLKDTKSFVEQALIDITKEADEWF